MVKQICEEFLFNLAELNLELVFVWYELTQL